MNEYSSIQYKSPQTLSLLTVGGLAAAALCDLLGVLFSFGGLLLPDINIPDEPTPIWFLLIGLVSLLEIAVFVFTVAVFLMWQFTTYKNLTPLKAKNLEATPGWAIAYWFIPFANLWKPYTAIREIWYESDPDFDPEIGFLPTSYGTSPIFGWWWAFWLLGNMSANVSARLSESDQFVNNGVFFVAHIIATAIGVGAAIFAILVVREITQRQELRAKRLNELGKLTNQFLPPPPPQFN